MRTPYSFFFALIIAITFSSQVAYGQALPMQWQQLYGGYDFDNGNAGIMATGSGYLFGSMSFSSDGDHHASSNGIADFWVIRTDDFGNLLWEQSYGGENIDILSDMIKSSKGYILSGYSASWGMQVNGHHGSPSRPNDDMWLVGIDTGGALLWSKTYGGSEQDRAFSMCKANDNGYMVAGYTNSQNGDLTPIRDTQNFDVWIVNINDTGGILWQKTYGDTGVEYTNCIISASNGGYIFAGFSTSNNGLFTGNHGSYDFWVVKIDDSGGMQWQKNFGGTKMDFVNSICQSSDGGYLIAGSTESNDGDITLLHGIMDMWLVKINKNGLVEWNKTYGGSKEQRASSAIATLDGGFIVTGWTTSTDGTVVGKTDNTDDCWVLKLDAGGNIQWQKIIGGQSNDFGIRIIQTPDSGYVITGTTYSKNDEFSHNQGLSDVWTIRLAKNPVIHSGFDNISDADKIQIAPTLNKGQFTVSLPTGFEFASINLYDMEGREMPIQTHLVGLQRKVVVCNPVPGNYLVSITNKTERKQFRITITN